MDKQQLNYYLYNYYNLKEQIEQKQQQITDLQFMQQAIKSSFGSVNAIQADGMPHSHNASSNGVVNSIIRKDEQIEKMQQQIIRYQNQIILLTQVYSLITELINELNTDEKEIFIRSYKKKENRIEICYEMGFECVTTITNKRQKILEKLDRKLRNAGVIK